VSLYIYLHPCEESFALEYPGTPR